MAAALTTISWFAVLAAIVPTVAIAMSIRFQEDREAKVAIEGTDITHGYSYNRRYRFLWASIPMALLLLGLVALSVFTCGDGCPSSHPSTRLFVASLAVGIFAWSLTMSLLYNRYFHSHAERPFRALIGGEWMLWLSVRVLSITTLAVALMGVFRF